MGQLSIVDFVLVLLVSNAVQNAMVGQSTSVPGGLVAAFTLILLNMGVSLQTQGLSVHSVLAITGLLLFIVAAAEAAARFSLRRVAAG